MDQLLEVPLRILALYENISENQPLFAFVLWLLFAAAATVGMWLLIVPIFSPAAIAPYLHA